MSGMAGTGLKVYIRDAFASTKQIKEWAFLTHLTSRSHHPFAIPTNETYIPLSNRLDDLSHYLNSISYGDR
ncbi:hypothetical protein PT974_09984 [Cladobotryum mycophilum]|uniref:Uncharacterized protein n=1 Tax=Cladobotryum mycophilum TaxID=491253 RepID=A0ABR0S9I8_9HYPO